jgi:medium-chain acyl-[acyl-carrier-protein] hydrolase
MCLPYAGGSATLFFRWRSPHGMPADIEVCSVQLPGRVGDEHGGPVMNRVDQIVARLGALVSDLPPMPLLLYGHSLGAVIAFELARRLRDGGVPVAHLMVGARRAPHLPSRMPSIHRLPDKAFLEALHRFYGTSLEHLRDPELAALVVPTLRGDITAAETHQHVAGPPLDVPITVFAGRGDEAVQPEEVAGWRLHTRARYTEHWLDAGHLFIDTHRAELLALLGRELRQTAE